MPSARASRRLVVRVAVCLIALCLTATAAGQFRPRKIGELELRLTGLSAVAEPQTVTVPKNTISGVRIAIRSGSAELPVAEAERLLGGVFTVEGELSGPGLRAPLRLPYDGGPSSDPLLVRIPPLPQAGNYTLSNLRITVNGTTALDVTPQTIAVDVIDQVLITSVTTRPLTLDEIRQKGIVLDNDSYLGFEFTLGLDLDSKVTEFTFPVVFDKRGVAVPQPLMPPIEPERAEMPPLTTIVPMLLQPKDGLPEPTVRLPNGTEAEVRIPSVLVIPGNVGYLKQFFSAKLFVANGAPGSSGLTVQDVTGTIKLPAGADQVRGSADDPLTLPDTNRGPQPATLAVRGAGLDGVMGTGDDLVAFKPGEQGETEFLLRGEKEGFHVIDFDVDATLHGLLTGPVKVGGTGSGGVLVRNPYFDMTFTAPAVVRQGERFTLYITVNNISESLANDVRVTLDASRMSGARVVGDATQSIDTLFARDARTLAFEFESDRTGQLIATYLNLETQNGSTGTLKFTLGIGERGVPLSPDTLVLPTSVAYVPDSVTRAAMRVLGQAWSVANAPSGTLPKGVIRTSRQTVTKKALALAEAGLRIELGQPVPAAVRDLLFDFYGGTSDPGFDQLLRTTNAGTELARALGGALEQTAALAGGAPAYEREVVRIAASGPDFVTFALSGAPGTISVTDREGRRSATTATSNTFVAGDVGSAVVVPFGTSSSAPLLVAVPAPAVAPYTLELSAVSAATVDFAVTLPASGGFRRATGSIATAAGGKYRIIATATDTLRVRIDADGDGTFESEQPLATEMLYPEGTRLLSATVIGPETLSGAAPFGQQTALLFDRVVDPASSSNTSRYTLDRNKVVSAKPQLSGRLVFATLEQPEGPYVPAQLSVTGIADARGVLGPAGTVSIGSRLRDIGAVVSGRVLNADGTPVGNAAVTYVQNGEILCIPPLDEMVGVSRVATDNDGRYEIRYVRQDQCGMAFQLRTNDPTTGALRQVSSSVRVAGEQIVLDIALFGRGSVTGTVRDLGGRPVAGATVVAISQTDPQSGGSAMTDIEGRYRIDDVMVGAVSVRAVKGASLGRSAGRIDRAGSAAVVDVTLDGGTVTARGTVRRVQGTDVTILPGIDVVYHSRGSGGGFIPIAATKSGDDGSYSFVEMPTGDYRITAALNSRDSGAVSGVAAAGDVLAADIAIVIGGEGYGTIRGVVRFPDGAPATGVIVAIDDRGLLTGADGSFELTGIIVKPTAQQQVIARSRDGLRTGSTPVLVSQPNQVISNVVVILSGLGSAEFTLLDARRQPVPHQEVALLGDCWNPCGCAAKETDAQGRVRFDSVPLGTVRVRATRTAGNLIDQATTSVSLTSDGATVEGVLMFSGAGVVTGTVRNPDGTPAVGATVQLRARVFHEDSCTLISGIAQRVRSDANGRFQFTGVNVGAIGVTASHPFFTTSVGANGTIVADGGAVDFTLTLVDTISGVLSGTVYLPDGTTPAGAGVEVTAVGPLPDVTVTTDAAGRYEFAKIFPQGTYTITARDPATGGVHQEQLYLRATEDITHHLRLKGRGTVRVTIVDGAGQPVTTNAYVRLQESQFPNRRYEAALEPASGGVVTFRDVFEGPLTAEANDAFARGGRSSSTLAGPGATLEMQVALTTTGTVNGHFRTPQGTPIPFGVIRLIVNGTTVGRTTTAGSDDVGSFSFTFVPAGSFRIEAQDPLTARSGLAVGSITSDGEIVVVDVTAQGVGRVEGIVTSNGLPQPGAHVDVTSGNFNVGTFSDSTGRYAIDGVPEGRVIVTASLSGNFLSGTNSGTLAGDGATLALDVSLRDSGTIQGTLHPAAGASPAPISLITAFVGGTGGAKLTTITDETGAFSFARVPAGLASLTAEVLGGIDKAVASAEVIGSETTTVAMTLNGVGSIAGTALDSSGQPIAGSIKVTGGGAFGWSFTVQSSSDGAFALPQVLAGPFSATLTAKSGEFTLYGTATGSIAAAQTTNVTIQVQPSGTVTGLVVRSDGSTPAVGATVVMVLDQNRGSVTVQTGNDGRFIARGVPLGGFTVRIDDPITTGLARVAASLASNGDTVDLGTVVLDDQPIRVLSIAPADGATDVSLTQPVVLTFSNSLQSTAGITIRKGSSTIGTATVLSSDGRTVTLTGTWPDSSELVVNVSTAVTDIFGRHPLETVTSRFRTIDTTAPSVSTVVPAAGTIQVAGDTTVTVTFNEPLDPAADTTSVVRLERTGTTISGTSALTAPAAITFTPSTHLDDNSTYTVKVTGARDSSGNVQTSTFTSTFATTDTAPPVLTITSPVPTSWTRIAQPQIHVNSTDAVSGIDPGTATLAIDGATVTPSVSGTSIYYTPPAPLSEGPHTLEASIADRAGNRGYVESTFKVDFTPPSAPTLSGVAEGATLRGELALSATAVDATSGVEKIELYVDGSRFLTLAPPFAASYNSAHLADGPRTFTARAVDAAANVGPYSAPVQAIVDNRPLTVTFATPVANAPVREVVATSVTVSEPVSHVIFTVGDASITDDAAPYEATFTLSAASDGPQTITATAYALSGETATGTRTFIIDRTPPGAPDVTRITAEPPANGSSLVFGYPGAVEGNAAVEITNTVTEGVVTTKATGDGSFSVYIAGAVDDSLSIVAIDVVGNRSDASSTTIRRTPSLPPSQGSTSLNFDGILVDRIGGTAGAVTPDGQLDAVFTVSLSIGDGATRTISYIDLTGPATRSTRAGLPVLGVAHDAGSALLNGSDNRVSFPVTSGTTLTLFAADGGFIREGWTYTVKAVFTDGSQFIGTYYIVPRESRTLVAHSADIEASPATVIVPQGGAGTTSLKLTNIRDIEGNLVPDGAKIALAVKSGASKTPSGAFISSAGGTIVDGEPAANNANFRVYTISGGSASATYSSSPVVPPATTGSTAVVQVQAADADDNVLGVEAISTIDLPIRSASDAAIVHAVPAALYADGVDRRSTLTIEVRDSAGNPVPDGTNVLVTAADGGSIAGCCWTSSAGGNIIGGTPSPSGSQYRVLTVAGGAVTAEYSSSGRTVGYGDVATARIQVLPADGNGNRTSLTAIGTGVIALTGAGSAHIAASPQTVPYVFPVPKPVHLNVHHIHDARSRLIPDGARVLVTATDGASIVGCCWVSSHGGVIVDGTPSPSGSQYKAFELSDNEARATYSTQGVPTVNTGDTRTAVVQVLAADGNGARLDARAIGSKRINILGPQHADGSVSPSTLFGDGSLYTANVRFEHILDVDGNPLPEGSKVVVSAADGSVVSGCCWLSSVGGQILNGEPSPTAGFKTFTITDGVVDVIYGNQGLTATPGQVRTARVALAQAGAAGERLSARALAVVPIGIAGATSAEVSASPSAFFADGADRRSTITISNLKDATGDLIPDGTLVGVTAVNGATVAGCCWVSSAGGTIVGDRLATGNSNFKLFPVVNGQVVVQYSSQGISVSSGERTAVVQVASASQSGSILSFTSLGTVPVRLLAPANAKVVAEPANVTALTDPVAQITVSDIRTSDGAPLPDGSKIALSATAGASVVGCCWSTSAGGTITSAGTVDGDGSPASNNVHFRIFTVAGGEVKAIYSGAGIEAGVGEVKTATIQVVAASASGATLSSNSIGWATVGMNGVTSTTATGPAAIPRSGGTATVIFSNIKDAAGNPVPDGTPVAVTVRDGAAHDAVWHQSAGGTITNGNDSPTSGWKYYSVQNGAVTVEYSTAGTSSQAVVRIQMVPARLNGTPIGNRTLNGGVWAITLN